MIEAAPFSRFSISILNNGYYNQQPDQWKLDCYNYQKKSILFFQLVSFDFICLFEQKNKKIVIKHVVCYGNN